MEIPQSRSSSRTIRDLAKILHNASGDLSNICSPPAFLAPYSVVEVGHCWAERPALFTAPAHEADPAKRAFLVLRHTLSSLRSQLYMGGSHTASIKKPLNAFLGEVFLASWTDDEAKSTTRVVAEQVSHHPPITATHVSDELHGVRADGYSCVEMTFNGNINICHYGHAMYHIDKYDEDYLIPLPHVAIRGFLSGRIYPEITGTYTIESSSGFASEIRFLGTTGGRWWGVGGAKERNAFTAVTFRKDDPSRTPIYETSGSWSTGWVTRDARTGEVVDDFDLDAPEHAPCLMDMAPLDEQDPWETRRAWRGVREALLAGDFAAAGAEKAKLEQAQRDMRAGEKAEGRSERDWKPFFFESGPGERYEAFHRLAKGNPDWELHAGRTGGVWRVVPSRRTLSAPLRGGLTPSG